nr:hypothetical protein [Tanacetum cinerariifolium]
MESVQDMSGCSIDQKVKYNAGSLMGKDLTWWKSQIRTLSWEVHELARLVPHLVTRESKKIERYVYGLAPQIRRMVAATKPKTMQKAVQIFDVLTDEAVRNGSIKKVEKRGNVGEPSTDKNGRDDNKRTRTGNAFATTANPVGRENTSDWPKGVLRNMNPVNARNLTVRACYECGSTDHVRNQGNQARGRAFMLGVDEARQDLNIVTSIKPSELGFRYEIEIASGQLVEIDKAELICHEKVVKIPLLDGKMLKVLGEKPKEKMRQLKSAKAKEKEQKEIVVVRYFPDVFPDDLSGSPPEIVDSGVCKKLPRVVPPIEAAL